MSRPDSKPTTDTTDEPTLLPQHLEDLRRSGLTDETIRACGFESIVDPGEIRHILN
jgi:hypothetical protein